MEEDNNKNSRKKIFRRGFTLGTAIALAVILAAMGGVLIYLSSVSDGMITAGSLSKMLTIKGIIDQYYIEDVDASVMTEGLYDGIMGSLGDDYADYYTAEEYQDMQVTTNGTYSGIGAVLTQDVDSKQVIITQVYEGSPAEEAGIAQYDELISVDGHEAADTDLTELVQKYIRGEEGSTVEIVCKRDGKEYTTEATRRQIDIPSVEYQMLDGNIGYVYIMQFTSVTPKQFENAMDDLKKQGMTAVIFDVRSDTGGLVDAAVEMLDYVLPEGTVLTVEDKNGNKETYTSDAEHYIDMPVVVLTNEYTASASEIFTGAIRDFDYGTLIGTKTYGKGIVQVELELKDGSAVKLTTAKYYTPSGECIHEVGITPDIELEYEFLGGEDDDYEVYYDNQILKAIEVINEERESEK